MKLLLTGVLEDGSPPPATGPINPRREIEITQGADVQLVVRMVNSAGAPQALTTGDQLRLALRRTAGPRSAPVGIRTATIAGNAGTFTLTSGDTALLQPGLYGFDVWLVRNGLHDVIVPLSPWKVLPSTISSWPST